MVEVKEGATVIQQNQFDGLNRRIVRDETGGTGNLRHFYYNQQWQVLEERVGTATTADKQYVYHPHYVDAIALSYDSAGVEHYYLQDANFNVTAITENTGTVVERYAYTPYGEVTVLDADFSADADNKSDISNELLYTGRRLDPETGLQLNRNRFYASHLGRWVNRDPIGYEGSEWNLYEYVNGIPLNGLDPTGEKVSGKVCVSSNCTKAFSIKPEDKGGAGSVKPGQCEDADAVGSVTYCWTAPGSLQPPCQETRKCKTCTFKVTNSCTANVDCSSGKPIVTVTCPNVFRTLRQAIGGGCIPKAKEGTGGWP